MPDDTHSGITHQVDRVDGALTRIAALIRKHPLALALLAFIAGVCGRELLRWAHRGEPPPDPAVCAAQLEACQRHTEEKIQATRELLDRCLPAAGDE